LRALPSKLLLTKQWSRRGEPLAPPLSLIPQRGSLLSLGMKSEPALGWYAVAAIAVVCLLLELVVFVGWLFGSRAVLEFVIASHVSSAQQRSRLYPIVVASFAACASIAGVVLAVRHGRKTWLFLPGLAVCVPVFVYLLLIALLSHPM
jgi:hypothetical protein